VLTYLKHIDIIVFNFINQTIANPLFDLFFPFVTNEVNWIIPLILFYLIIFKQNWKKAILVFVITFISVVITDLIAAQIIKPLVGRIRPSHEFIDSARLLVGKGGKYTFPSNHAANTMTFALLTSFFYSNTKKMLIAIVCLVSISRVYVGVHYPLDVIAGCIFGTFISIAVLHCFSYLKIYSMIINERNNIDPNELVVSDSNL